MAAPASILSSITVGTPYTSGPLTMWPLLGANGHEPFYDLAAPAFAAGTLTVQEISRDGSVPTLRVVNAGPRPVLLLDGEQLVGAKQNRVLNVTVLVAAHTTLDVPVSCVEHGRWRYTRPDLRTDDYLMNAELRARKMRDVSDTLRHRMSRAGDQRAVWVGIADKAAHLSADSPTGAMRDTYERHREPVEQFTRDLAPLSHQLGAIFAAHGHFLGVEVFDSPTTLAARCRVEGRYPSSASARRRRSTSGSPSRPGTSANAATRSGPTSSAASTSSVRRGRPCVSSARSRVRASGGGEAIDGAGNGQVRREVRPPVPAEVGIERAGLIEQTLEQRERVRQAQVPVRRALVLGLEPAQPRSVHNHDPIYGVRGAWPSRHGAFRLPWLPLSGLPPPYACGEQRHGQRVERHALGLGTVRQTRVQAARHPEPELPTEPPVDEGLRDGTAFGLEDRHGGVECRVELRRGLGRRGAERGQRVELGTDGHERLVLDTPEHPAAEAAHGRGPSAASSMAASSCRTWYGLAMPRTSCRFSSRALPGRWKIL
jgi:hypothetical protein